MASSANPASTPPDCDVLICGGGTSGAALAGILARDTDLRITVLEAGPDYGALADGGWPRDLLDASTLCRSHQWAYAGSAHASHSRVTGYDRARVIGGCSAHNGCVALIGHRADYDGWAALGNTGWSWDDVAPAVERAKAAIRVQIPHDDTLTPWQARFIDAAVAAGIPRSANLNDPEEDQGVAASPANIHDGMRWNTALAYLDPVRSRPNLTIVPEALVDRVLLDGDRAIGVEAIVSGERRQFHAARVVLSGGAYGTPAMLLRSGIGPGAHLREVGVPLLHELPGVGARLTDHPAIGLFMEGATDLGREMDARRAAGWSPDEQALAKVRSQSCSAAFDLHLYAVSERSPASGAWRYQIAIAHVAPQSSASVRLASARPQDAPLIDHGFLTDAAGHDIEGLIDGVELASEMLRTSVMTRAFGDGPERLHRDDLRAYVIGDVGIYYHPACSCRMGPSSDPTAVVDPYGRVHGLRNLWLCDASIFPVIPRANTCLPAVLLAEHMAGWVADSAL